MSDPYATMKTTTNKGQKMTEREILAENILARYTPFAFSCECGGKDWDCELATNDPYLNGVMDTVRRIYEYILDFDATH